MWTLNNPLWMLFTCINCIEDLKSEQKCSKINIEMELWIFLLGLNCWSSSGRSKNVVPWSLTPTSVQLIPSTLWTPQPPLLMMPSNSFASWDIDRMHIIWHLFTEYIPAVSHLHTFCIFHTVGQCGPTLQAPYPGHPFKSLPSSHLVQFYPLRNAHWIGPALSTGLI